MLWAYEKTSLIGLDLERHRLETADESYEWLLFNFTHLLPPKNIKCVTGEQRPLASTWTFRSTQGFLAEVPALSTDVSARYLPAVGAFGRVLSAGPTGFSVIMRAASVPS